MLALAFVLISAASAPDSAVQTQLNRGKAAIAELEYEVAAEELMAVATAPAATEAEKVEANLLAGVVHRILGNNVEAKLHFMYVLTREPKTQLPPGQPPKVTGFYELVREEAINLNALRNANRPAPAPAPAPAPQPAVVATDEPPPKASTPGPIAPLPEANLAEETGVGPSALFLTGVSVAALGAVVFLGGGALGLLADSTFLDPTAATKDRVDARTGSLLGWSTNFVGFLLLTGGAGLAVYGALE